MDIPQEELQMKRSLTAMDLAMALALTWMPMSVLAEDTPPET